MFCVIASAAKQSPESWPADRAYSVVPAKAGTHLSEARTAEGWVPAFAGTTVWDYRWRIALRLSALRFWLRGFEQGGGAVFDTAGDRLGEQVQQAGQGE